MATSSFNLDLFRSEVLSGSGLARTNKFEVQIQKPRGLVNEFGSVSANPSSDYDSISRVVSLYVEQASIPLLNIITKSFKIFGPSYQRPLTSEYGGEGLPITFHVDRNMNIRSFFEDWMHLIINPNTFTVGYQEDYATNIIIKQLDEQNSIVYEIELIEAYPRNLNVMELNNTSANQTHRLTVNFAYRYWRRVVKSDPKAIPRIVKEPQIPVLDAYEPSKESPSIGNPMGDISENGNYW